MICRISAGKLSKTDVKKIVTFLHLFVVKTNVYTNVNLYKPFHLLPPPYFNIYKLVLKLSRNLIFFVLHLFCLNS